MSTSVAVVSDVDLAWMLTNHLCQIMISSLATEQVKMEDHITVDNIVIHAEHRISLALEVIQL